MLQQFIFSKNIFNFVFLESTFAGLGNYRIAFSSQLGATLYVWGIVLGIWGRGGGGVGLATIRESLRIWGGEGEGGREKMMRNVPRF